MTAQGSPLREQHDYAHNDSATERSPLLNIVGSPSVKSSRNVPTSPSEHPSGALATSVDVPTCRKYLILIAALINCLWAGSVLLYSLYAPLFQRKLGYSQVQVNAISVAADIGMYLPVPLIGYICDLHGPALLSVISALLFGPAYAGAAWVYREGHSSGDTVQGVQGWAGVGCMMAAFACIGIGASTMYFAGIVACAKAFPGGNFALALPIACFGMSSLWQSQLVSRLFSPDGDVHVESVFWFFSACLTAVGVVSALCFNVINREKPGLEVSAGEEEPGQRKPWLTPETKIFLQDRSMWFLALGVFLVAGVCEAFINNMGSLIQTLTPPGTSAVDTASQVSILALSSTTFRLLIGVIADLLAPGSSYGRYINLSISRVTMLLCACLFIVSALLFLTTDYIYAHPSAFWYISVCMGGGYGAFFSIAPTIVSVVWGSRNFGTNWGIVTVTPALGATIFGALWAANYDYQAGKNGLCYGKTCASLSAAVMAAGVLVAMAGWIWAWRGPLGWKSRPGLML